MEENKNNTQKQPEQKKKKKSDVLLTIALIAAIVVFCYAAFNLYHIYTEYKKGTDEYNQIEEMAVTERDADSAEVAGPNAQLKPPIEVDFDKLKSVNEDVVGWIYVDALPDISYPIVKGKDNQTYLHQTYEKNYNFAGTIFVDYENSGDFSDCNTLVYGHNMKNGSMFGHLKKFREDDKLYKQDKYFWILTPERNYRYEIISAYTTGVNSDTYTLFKGPGEEFEKYLETIKGYYTSFDSCYVGSIQCKRNIVEVALQKFYSPFHKFRSIVFCWSDINIQICSTCVELLFCSLEDRLSISFCECFINCRCCCGKSLSDCNKFCHTCVLLYMVLDVSGSIHSP